MNCPRCYSRHVIAYPVTVEQSGTSTPAHWVRCNDCGLSEQAGK